MWFWAKHLVATVILIGIAAYLLMQPDSVKFSTGPATPAAPKKMAAAKEFTSFYEQLRYSLDASSDRSKEFIVKLPDTSDKLTETLSSRTNVVPPLAEHWTGKSEQRKFAPGSKIRDQMASFAGAEGIELVWTLPRDYVVKHYFENQGDYLSALKEIASAIAPDFQSPVLVYLCPKERAAVVTDKSNPFLLDHCTHLNPERQQKREVPSAN